MKEVFFYAHWESSKGISTATHYRHSIVEVDEEVGVPRQFHEWLKSNAAQIEKESGRADLTNCYVVQ